MNDPATAAAGLALALVAVILTRRAARTAARLAAGHSPENILTLLAAVIATIVQGTGMWRFFGVTLHLAGPLRGLLFAFIELALFVEALRARRNVIESGTHTAGADGIAVWVLAGLSAVLSSLDARSFAEAVFRLAVPPITAWLWERLMAVERRRATGRSIHWRITPERVLVRLGVAEPTDRTATEVDAHRRIARLARAAKNVRALRAADVTGRRLARALGRLDAAMDAAVEHTGLATDQDRQDDLIAHLAVLYGAAGLSELTPASPWAPPPPPTMLRLVRTGQPQLRLDVLDDVPGRTPGEAPKQPDERERNEEEKDVPEPVPAELEKLVLKARRRFDRSLAAGTPPSIADLKKALGVGQPKATAVQTYLTTEKGA